MWYMAVSRAPCLGEKFFHTLPFPIREKHQQGEISDLHEEEEERRKSGESNDFKITRSFCLFDGPKYNFIPLPHSFLLLRIMIALLLVPFST